MPSSLRPRRGVRMRSACWSIPGLLWLGACSVINHFDDVKPQLTTDGGAAGGAEPATRQEAARGERREPEARPLASMAAQGAGERAGSAGRARGAWVPTTPERAARQRAEPALAVPEARRAAMPQEDRPGPRSPIRARMVPGGPRSRSTPVPIKPSSCPGPGRAASAWRATTSSTSTPATRSMLGSSPIACFWSPPEIRARFGSSRNIAATPTPISSTRLRTAR